MADPMQHEERGAPGAMPAVSLICLSDRPLSLAVFLSALQVQSRRDWEAIVLDQTEGDDVSRVVAAAVDRAGDSRISWRRVPRRGDWGQMEKWTATAGARGDWVGFPNDDAYYCPRYLELMLARGEAAGAELVFCNWVSAADGPLAYSPYVGWPRTGHIDVGGFLVRRARLLSHGWPDRGPTGDGALVEGLVRSGAAPCHVPATLYVKN